MNPRCTDLLSRVVLIAGATASVATDCSRPLCDDDDECRASCQRNLERAAEADADAAAAAPVELAALSCTEATVGAGDDEVSERPHCACESEERNYDLWGGDGHCLVVARNASCLLWATELPRDVCVPGDAASCAPVCDDLEALLTEDASRTVTRTLVEAECNFSCYCTADIDGTCFTYPDFGLEGLGPESGVPCP
ncbi:MAG: hypothetical protein A2138_01720 [Deltaproteobacteria bacterium RBG_16_71_12]|nr:MAG: hypothetical protein A2138_01720 [Deltaproteobacteria bacterium RBG_16_71_12]